MSKLKDWASSKSGKTKEKYLKLIKTAFDVDQFCSMIIKCKEETGLYPAKVDLAARALQFVEEGKKKEINKPTDEEL